MIGVLSKEQSLHVLRSELVGRIGCYSAGKVYVVPVTYVVDDNYVYAHSKEGLKINMLRKNPKVCFEVESLESMANWRTVIVWGKYEELKKLPNQKKAMKILYDRIFPFVVSDSVKPVQFKDTPEKVDKEQKPVLYRISIDEISGRFEKSK